MTATATFTGFVTMIRAEVRDCGCATRTTHTHTATVRNLFCTGTYTNVCDTHTALQAERSAAQFARLAPWEQALLSSSPR